MGCVYHADVQREYHCQGCGAVETLDYPWPRRAFWCGECEGAYRRHLASNAGSILRGLLGGMAANVLVVGGLVSLGLPIAMAMVCGLGTLLGVLVTSPDRDRRRYFAMQRGAAELPPATMRRLPAPAQREPRDPASTDDDAGGS